MKRQLYASRARIDKSSRNDLRMLQRHAIDSETAQDVPVQLTQGRIKLVLALFEWQQAVQTIDGSSTFNKAFLIMRLQQTRLCRTLRRQIHPTRNGARGGQLPAAASHREQTTPAASTDILNMNFIIKFIKLNTSAHPIKQDVTSRRQPDWHFFRLDAHGRHRPSPARDRNRHGMHSQCPHLPGRLY